MTGEEITARLVEAAAEWDCTASPDVSWRHGLIAALLPVVRQIADQRARIERQRTLADARAALHLFTTSLAAVMLTRGTPDGIHAAFDRWALSEYHTLADPDRWLCGECGRRHTDYEYGDAHRNPEGGP